MKGEIVDAVEAVWPRSSHYSAAPFSTPKSFRYKRLATAQGFYLSRFRSNPLSCLFSFSPPTLRLSIRTRLAGRFALLLNTRQETQRALVACSLPLSTDTLRLQPEPVSSTMQFTLLSALIVTSAALGGLASPLGNRIEGDASLHKRFTNSRWTFYDVGLGACGETNVNSDYVCPIPSRSTLTVVAPNMYCPRRSWHSMLISSAPAILAPTAARALP